MSVKINVTDRVPTYPGRVIMTPVNGQANTYDMVRADAPVQEGTPVGKNLFDHKSDRLVESATVYVATTGNDSTGDGTSSKPFKTIQRAVDELPKDLNGKHAIIDIANGTYNERVTIDGFTNGRLTLGADDRTVTVRGVSVMSSAAVRLNITNITYSSSYAGTLLYADYGSNVTIINSCTFRGEGAAVSGIAASRGSTITAASVTVAMLSFGAAAVLASTGSKIALGTVEGNGNTSNGLRAELGSIISYASKNLTATGGDLTASGGRIYTAAQN